MRRPKASTTPYTAEQAAFAELMYTYKEKRLQWVEEFGSADGFDEWFTEQVYGPATA